jgi:hypothetical protein
LQDRYKKIRGRFFHGYYCSLLLATAICRYLPLYIFSGDQVLCARLREANHDAPFGSLQEIRRVLAQIRASRLNRPLV